jgi:protein tyrosine phosphatase (PTP) superfamily phosphohydrolase (DUF442 family)
MNPNFGRLLSGVALAALAISGCQHACRQPCPPSPPPTVNSPFAAPGAAIPFAPPPSAVPQAPVPPVSAPSATRSYEPPFASPAEPSWRIPSDSGIRLAPPEDASSPPAVGGARLRTPDFSAPSPSRSPLGEERSPTPLLPAGIPQFAIAKDQIATGLKPMLDGVDWLKQNGYRAVLHLRQPGEDDAAERNLFEMRGLKYLSLELSPQTLSRTVVDEFNRIVNDHTNHPLFVYDKTGSLTGSLWYLHFREVEHQSDAEARTRAGRLGLRETPNGLQQEMWLAIQKYLSEPKN